MAKASKKFLKASWPAFGGKSAVAKMCWERFGNVDNYIEPFANSAAMLLKNPWGGASYETLNDLNCYVANYWRAVQKDPEAVAIHSDWPVSEIDLHARHRYLVIGDDAKVFRDKILADPEYFDAKFAGWWAWGQCQWIGSGWCDVSRKSQCKQIYYGGTGQGLVVNQKRPSIGNKRGVSGNPSVQRPDLAGGYQFNNHRPQLADAHSRGRGVHSNDSAGTCEERRLWLMEWMKTLSDRLRNVRVCCGDWKRVCSSVSVTTRLGLTGVFLDPPYRTHVEGKESRSQGLYATDHGSDLDKLAKDVQVYCLKHGGNPKMRIAVCALEGEGYEVLTQKGWQEVQWKSSGYGMRTEKGQENAARERIWYSPGCLVPERDIHPLFVGLEEDSSLELAGS
jgi:hypothetical protein